MPTSCVPINRCGTHAPGWLSGGHPSSGQIRSVKVCFHWSNNCCRWHTYIRVRNCGGFYVYEFKRPPACHLRYCGNSGKKGPKRTCAYCFHALCTNKEYRTDFFPITFFFHSLFLLLFYFVCLFLFLICLFVFLSFFLSFVPFFIPFFIPSSFLSCFLSFFPLFLPSLQFSLQRTALLKPSISNENTGILRHGNAERQ